MHQKNSVIFLTSRADVHRLPPHARVESEHIEWLKEALRRHPASVNPTRVPSFHRENGFVQLAKEARVSIELPLTSLLHLPIGPRARRLYKYRRFLSLCLRLNAAFVLVSEPQAKEDERSAREWESVAVTFFGLSREQARRVIRIL
ncbi:hypothetical protein KJ765_04175 [Candidatus Micrarchaeota archaeon]|nr:hypothetical protein [Candidatus Micrarchaeota archaeon]